MVGLRRPSRDDDGRRLPDDLRRDPIALAGFASLVSVIARAGGDPPILDENRPS